MNEIEALLFDLGGVVFAIDFDRAFQSWQAYSRLDPDELRGRFAMDLPYQRHERGEIAAAEYFSHLRAQLQLDASDAEISAGWNAIFGDELTETIDCIRKVSARLPCFAFSNSNPTHQQAWLETYPGSLDAFERIFVSSELGLRKPEAAAFDAIAAATGIRLEAQLFFDDTEENVHAARDAGMPAVHVRSHDDVIRALQDNGLL